MVVLHMHNRTDAFIICEYLQEYKEGKWGFIIYRTCYYDDQERWNRFMERLKDFARTNILSLANNRDGDGAAIIDLLEWNVHEDPAMEGCSFGEVRRRHRELMISLEGDYCPASPRQGHPIFADKDSVDSVLAGPAPGDWGSEDSHNLTAYIIVVGMCWWDDRDEKNARGPLSEGVEDMEFEPDDQGYPPINGCRMYDVGWAKVSVRKLYPRLYCLLTSSDFWGAMYQRPPKIAKIP